MREVPPPIFEEACDLFTGDLLRAEMIIFAAPAAWTQTGEILTFRALGLYCVAAAAAGSIEDGDIFRMA